jgi:hypothetical protein
MRSGLSPFEIGGYRLGSIVRDMMGRFLLEHTIGLSESLLPSTGTQSGPQDAPLGGGDGQIGAVALPITVLLIRN